MSERLTRADSLGEDGKHCEDCEYYGEPNGCNREDGACDAYTNHQDLYQRLFDIESILYDADGNELISLARLRELAEAERDGRVVVYKYPNCYSCPKLPYMTVWQNNEPCKSCRDRALAEKGDAT